MDGETHLQSVERCSCKSINGLARRYVGYILLI